MALAQALSTNILWHGADAAPPVSQWLTAGPLAVALEEGQLRGVWLGGCEVVQRIYGAVRDRFWNTVPGVITDFEVLARPGGFRVVFTSRHVSAATEVDFVWRAEITGEADGTLRYVFDGEARREMGKNRVGLCVLHPLWLAGKGGRAEYVSGDRAAVKFPELVDAAQPVRGLHDFRELRHGVADGVEAVFSFEGDMFEIEDQRNWTDASFKTYSTPQRIPLPAVMYAGQKVRQSVTLRLEGPNTSALPAGKAPAEPGTVTITAGKKAGVLPEIGTGVAYHGDKLTDSETARLRALGLAHYRVEVDTSRADWLAVLERGLREAEDLDAMAEAAVFLPEDAAQAEEMLSEIAKLVDRDYFETAIRWIVLTRVAPATRAATLRLAREHLASLHNEVGGGTDADFFQLNNNRVPAEGCDFVSVPLRPLAHQFDPGMMAINLQGQREVLRTMAALWPGKRLAVSPVSLRTRAQKGPAAGPGELPAQADVRQMSLLGAAWTVGCVKAVAESGAHSLTLFQTTGLRGLMPRAESAEDAAVEEFHAVPGGVYPVYHVLAALAEWRGAAVVESVSDAPLAVQALVLEKDGKRAALVANLTARERRVALGDGAMAGGKAKGTVKVKVKVLHSGNAVEAMREPDGWWGRAEAVEVEVNGDGVIVLPAFGVAVAAVETVH